MVSAFSTFWKCLFPEQIRKVVVSLFSKHNDPKKDDSDMGQFNSCFYESDMPKNKHASETNSVVSSDSWTGIDMVEMETLENILYTNDSTLDYVRESISTAGEALSMAQMALSPEKHKSHQIMDNHICQILDLVYSTPKF